MAKKFTVTEALMTAYASSLAIAPDAGAGAPQGSLKIFPGPQPANPEAPEGQTELVAFDLNNPAFGGPVTVPGPPRLARITADVAGLTSTATGAGVAAWYRVYDRDGAAVYDGSAGEAADDPDLVLSNKNIAEDDEVTLTAWTIDVPEVL